VEDGATVADAKKAILERAEALARDTARVAELRAQLDSKIDMWKSAAIRAGAQGSLTYADGSHALLKDAGATPASEFTCLNSMRNVEPSLLLLFQDDGMEQTATGNAGGRA
jgi:hypothetical protein